LKLKDIYGSLLEENDLLLLFTLLLVVIQSSDGSGIHGRSSVTRKDWISSSEIIKVTCFTAKITIYTLSFLFSYWSRSLNAKEFNL
jgi:hypothetical protein